MDVFVVCKPKGQTVPIVASLPHSGTDVPPRIAQQFTEEHRRTLINTDWYLRELYSFLPELGITTIAATHSRYVVDLNREVKEPKLGNFWASVVALETATGKPIYLVPPTAQDIEERVNRYYWPYHERLSQIIATIASATPESSCSISTASAAQRPTTSSSAIGMGRRVLRLRLRRSRPNCRLKATPAPAIVPIVAATSRAITPAYQLLRRFKSRFATQFIWDRAVRKRDPS